METSYIDHFKATIDENHILLHPFYQAWNNGNIPKSVLQDYAKQYFTHVEMFPRYLSRLHSNCKDLKSRKLLLDNLIEEEGGDYPHSKMWVSFANGLDIDESELIETKKFWQTEHLVKSFFNNCDDSYAKGLGTLFCYEYQTPKVASFKLKTLQDHYNITDPNHTLFYHVHSEVDIEHAKIFQELIEELDDDEKEMAFKGGMIALKSMWVFLDAFPSIH